MGADILGREKEQVASILDLPSVAKRADTNGEGGRKKPRSSPKTYAPILMLSRKEAQRGGGRTIENEKELLAAIRNKFAKSVGKAQLHGNRSATNMIERVLFEEMSVKQQIAAMQKTKVFVAGRGAGTVNTLFLPQGASIVYLNIYQENVPLKLDQVPWNPSLTFAPNRTTIVVNCAANTGAELRGLNGVSKTDKRRSCDRNSVNFCPMKCNEKRVANAVALAWAAAEGHSWALKKLQNGPFGSRYLLPSIVHRLPLDEKDLSPGEERLHYYLSPNTTTTDVSDGETGDVMQKGDAVVDKLVIPSLQ